jgi:sigma-B regulation protein RsbU (phosphoserine phosphatase)
LESIESDNFPVGMFPDAEFVSGTTQMHSGDYLIIYTDGVSEAKNVRGKLFEEAGLRGVLQEFQGSNVEQLAEAVRTGVQKFTEGAPQSDDITVLVARFLGTAA